MMTSSEEDIWSEMRGLTALSVSVAPEKSFLCCTFLCCSLGIFMVIGIRVKAQGRYSICKIRGAGHLPLSHLLVDSLLSKALLPLKQAPLYCCPLEFPFF